MEKVKLYFARKQEGTINDRKTVYEATWKEYAAEIIINGPIHVGSVKKSGKLLGAPVQRYTEPFGESAYTQIIRALEELVEADIAPKVEDKKEAAMTEKNTHERPWKKDETTPNIDYWSHTLGEFEAKTWIKGRKVEDGYTWEVWDGWRRETTGTAPSRDEAMSRADEKMRDLHDTRAAYRLGYDRLDALRNATDQQRPFAKRLLWGGMSTIPQARLGDYEGHIRLDVSKVWEFEIRRVGDMAGPGAVVGYGHEDSLIEAVAAVEDRLHKFKAAADECKKLEEDRKKAAAEEAARLEKEKAERPTDKRLTWAKDGHGHYHCAEGNITGKVAPCTKPNCIGRWDAEVRMDGAGVFHRCIDSLNAARGAAEAKIDELVKAALAFQGAAKAPEKVPEDLSVHTTHVNVGGKIVLSVTWKDVIHPTVPRVYGESNEAGRGMKAEIYLDADNRWVWAVGRQGAIGRSGYSSALGKAKTDATESIWELIEAEDARARKQEELRDSVAKAEADGVGTTAHKMAQEQKDAEAKDFAELQGILKHFKEQSPAFDSSIRLRETDNVAIICSRKNDGSGWNWMVRTDLYTKQSRGSATTLANAQLQAAKIVRQWAIEDAEELKKDVKIHFEDADKKAAAAQHHAPVTTADVRKAAERHPGSAEALGIHVLANGNLLFDPFFVAKSAIEDQARMRVLRLRLDWLAGKLQSLYDDLPQCTETGKIAGDCTYADCAECRMGQLLDDQRDWAEENGLAGDDR
jgi:hypothetical protein